METIGPWELLIIVAVLVALFGSSRLPSIGRSLGEGLREFRNGLSEASQTTGADPASGSSASSDSASPGGSPSASP